MSGRPNKRSRTTDGHSYHNVIPLGADDLLDVQAREGRLIKVGYQTFTAPTTRITQKSNEHRNVAEPWAPSDNAEFALDPNAALYDTVVEGPIVEDTPSPASAGNKKAKSQLSVTLLDALVIPMNLLCLHMTEEAQRCLERPSLFYLLR